MNYKEKVERILNVYVEEYDLRMARIIGEEQVAKDLVEELTALYEQAQRDAIEGFANWVYENYNEGEIKMYGDGEDLSINLLCRFYLNQTKEDIKQTQ